MFGIALLSGRDPLIENVRAGRCNDTALYGELPKAWPTGDLRNSRWRL
jgi:hypothetical protein